MRCSDARFCGRALPGSPVDKNRGRRGDLLRLWVNHGLSAAKESPGCIHVPGRAEHRIHQIAFAINGAIQITPLALNLQVGLVDIPAEARFPLPFAAEVLSQQRSEPFLPVAYGFVRKLEAT